MDIIDRMVDGAKKPDHLDDITWQRLKNNIRIMTKNPDSFFEERLLPLILAKFQPFPMEPFEKTLHRAVTLALGKEYGDIFDPNLDHIEIDEKGNMICVMKKENENE